MDLRILVSSLLLLAGPSAVAAQSVLFREARVFTGDSIIPSADVLVRDGVIAAVGRGLTATSGTNTIEARGMTLLPGFIDAHTHSFGDALREALMFGVTTNLDQFTEATMLRAVQAEQAAGRADARADLYSAGVLVTAPGGHGTQYGFPIPTITTPGSAEAFVAARIAEGSHWIKIVMEDGSTFNMTRPTLDEATMRAVITAAHRQDRIAVVHVSTAAHARAAIDAGADGLVHLFVDRAPPADLAGLAAARGAFVIPTLVVLKSMTGVGGAAPLADDPRIAPYLAPASRMLVRQGFQVRPGASAPRYEHAMDAVRRLHAAGVPILAGSDAPNPGTAHGAALHRELELLVAAGLSPLDALRAATSEPARRFRLPDRGRIAPGLRADLVLVEGDPVQDITATRAIAGVWKAGVAADRAAFASAVAAQIAAAANPGAALATGLISDFETGAAAASFGTAWTVTTDAMAGGGSTARLDVTDGGAQGSTKALRISGEISGTLPYAWAGATWSPGAGQMQPADLSSKREIVFDARGCATTCRVLVFAEASGMTPLMHEFTAGAEWTEIAVPWTALGTDGRGVMAIMLLGGPQPGAFAFEVDNVRLR